MARLLGQTFNLSFKNCVKTGFVSSKNYSVLYSCHNKLNYDNRSGVNIPQQKIQYRNFSFEGYLQFIDGVSNSPVCCMIRENLLNLHESFGLPWWSVVLLTTATARISLIGLTGIYQEKVITEMWRNRSSAENRVKEKEKRALELAKKNKWTLEKTLKIIKDEQKEEVKQDRQRAKLLLFRSVVLVFTQLGLWLLITLSFRNLNLIALSEKTEEGKVLKEQLSNEGTLWFKNLLKPDKYILPAIVVASNLVIIEIQDLKRGTKTKIVTYVLRGFALFVGYICALTPSCISFFWTTSSFVALVQNFLLLSPRVRKIFRIGNLEMLGDYKHPYRVLWNRFKIKWNI